MTTPHDHLSDRELAAMTDQLDRLHHDQALPAMKAAVAEWIDSFKAAGRGTSHKGHNRRTFLLGAAGISAGGVVLAACGSSSKSAAPSATAPTPSGTGTGTSASTPSGSLTGDLAVAATAASLENLGVYAYKAGLSAAAAGKLGKVPPAVATFAQTVMGQHQDHARAWNAALTAAGKTAVTATDPALTPTVNQKFGQVTNATQLAQLALLIENIAAQTYQAAIPPSPRPAPWPWPPPSIPSKCNTPPSSTTCSANTPASKAPKPTCTASAPLSPSTPPPWPDPPPTTPAAEPTTWCLSPQRPENRPEEQ